MIDKPISRQTYWSTIYNNKRLLIIFLLGFAAGLPASLTASTLQAWFTEEGLNLYTIGAVTLLILPYSLRFIWAPLFDHYTFPGFDRRRGWLLVIQLGLLISIYMMANLSPLETLNVYVWTLPKLMIVGFFTAVLSSSLEIVINAYQTEMLAKNEQGLGASIYVTGWRIGSIISGALALVLANKWGWHYTYLLMAALSLIGIVTTFLAPSNYEIKSKPSRLLHDFSEPFKDFIRRFGFKSTLIFFLLILTYKATDALALALNTTFLLREIGFDLTTVGLVNKTISISAAILGGIFAGILMKQLQLYRALMLFGLIQGIATLSYALLAYAGKSFSLLIITACIENFCSGMGNIALLALIMTLANTQYTATQIAILSALAYLTRPIVGPLAAILVQRIGWIEFYIVCFLISFPTLFLIYLSKEKMLNLKHEG